MSKFKEQAIWAMIIIVCILAIVLVLRYKDKIDGYQLTTVKWLGSISYYSPDIPGDNMTVWGGKIIDTQVIDATVEVGLDSKGFLRWRKAEGKK